MDLSSLRVVDVSCPECGTQHQALIWSVADFDSRVDLLARARSGHFTFCSCPNGHQYEIDEPLLVVRRNFNPPLLYLRDDRGTPDDEALAHVLEVVPQEKLPELFELSNRCAMGSGRRLLLPVAATPTPETLKVLSTVDELLFAVDEMHVARVIIEHEELSSRPALEALRTIAASQQGTAAGDHRASQILKYAAMLMPDARTATVAWCRYELSRALPDLNSAVASLDHSLSSRLPADTCAVLHGQLCIALERRYRLTGRREDLMRAVETARAGLAKTKPDGLAALELSSNLGVLLAQRHRLTAERADIDEAIEIAENAISFVPEESPALGLLRNQLSGFLSQRYAATGDRSDLEASLGNVRAAIDLAPGHSAERPICLNNLGKYLADRYVLTGRHDDLNEAISAAREAVRLAPVHSYDLPDYLHNLSSHISRLYLITGRRSDLDEALAIAADAINVAPAESPHLARDLNNLSNHLSTLYEVTGDISHLHTAVDAARRSLDLLRERTSAPTLWNNLGNRLAKLFQKTGELYHLNEAIAASREAVRLTPERSPQLAQHFNNLSAHLLLLHSVTHGSDDLDQSIAAAMDSIRYSPETIAERSGYLSNLSEALSNRYKMKHDRADLDRAISAAQEAVDREPTGSPLHPVLLARLGYKLSMLHTATGQRSDLDAAVKNFKSALSGFQALAMESDDAREVTNLSAAASLEATALLLNAGNPAEIVTILEMTKAARLRSDLSRSNRIPANLSEKDGERYDSIRRRLREIAASLRELGAGPAESRVPAFGAERLKMSSEQQALRTERSKLEARDPAFEVAPLDYAGVARYSKQSGDVFVYLQPTDIPQQGLAIILVHPGTPEEGPPANDVILISGFDRGALKKLMLGQMDRFLESPHTYKPAQEECLGWITADMFANADGPNAVAGHHLWLRTQKSVIEQLGAVLTPVALRLREIEALRVVLIAGDLLAFLPLHAAPINGSAETFGEVYETRYAPSVTTLSLASAAVPNGTDRATTLVGIANPDGSLVFSDIEMRLAAATFAPNADVRHGREATRTWLLQRSPTADVLALSTHARLVVGNPLQSSFLLAATSDGVHSVSTDDDSGCDALSLEDLWRGVMKLKPGAVVVADACETGQIDMSRLAEEFIGFPSAFLASGAATVVASFWSVSDFSTALLMESFYSELRAGKRPALALQRAARALRMTSVRDGVVRLSLEARKLETSIAESEARSATSLTPDKTGYDGLILAADEVRGLLDRLKGMNPDQNLFSHPFHWAAFAVHGA